jgi:hypothetical protein
MMTFKRFIRSEEHADNSLSGFRIDTTLPADVHDSSDFDCTVDGPESDLQGYRGDYDFPTNN